MDATIRLCTLNLSGIRWRWLAMIGLTLSLPFFPSGSDHFSPLIIFSSLAAVVKGFWIINDFMELKHAPRLLKWLLMIWLLVTTSAVTTAALWQP